MIALLKATPVFVDIEPDTYNLDANLIEAAITKKTKAIMPVSLYGQPADIDAIQAIADKYNLKVIIDGAQSFGSTFNKKTDSNLDDISTTSFFPSKPLGCYGDGGAVFTNNEDYAKKIKLLRVHGQNKRYHHQYIGIGGRLDTIQAAILLAKLPHFSKELKDFIQTCIMRVTEFLHISMPTLNPVGDTSGYTLLIVQPLVYLISHCSASEQTVCPEDPIHHDGRLPGPHRHPTGRLGGQVGPGERYAHNI